MNQPERVTKWSQLEKKQLQIVDFSDDARCR